ncbi:FHA domain-containing protein [Aphelenchoides fujianensis]|nr:FHA domain-containing protein [Aphelenchoides fujianensis]
MENNSTTIRRSTRDIKRPKFDDEIVQSVPIPIKAVLKKRSDRTLQSPDFAEFPPDDQTNFPSGGSHKAEAAELGDERRECGEAEHFEREGRENPLKQRSRRTSGQSSCPIGSGRNACRPPTNRTIRKSQSKSQDGEASVSNISQNIPETLRTWTVQDDVLLITSVTHLCDLDAVHAMVKFSKDFPLHEIDTRWYGILYDEAMNRATMERIEKLPQDELLEDPSEHPVQRGRREKIIANQPLLVVPHPNQFEDVLTEFRSVFHHARTPAALEQHWKSMKHYGLLAEQSLVTFDDDLLRLEREYDMTRFAKDDVILPMDVEERNYLRDLQRANLESDEWEKVLIRAVKGIPHLIEFDRDTMAVLKGRCVSFDIRKDRVLIGRSTQKHRVDVNLTFEGPTAAISRRQALLRIEPSGRSLFFNIGEASVYVDRRPVRKNGRAELHHNSVIEIGPIRLLFARNEELFRHREEEQRPVVSQLAESSASTSTSTESH